MKKINENIIKKEINTTPLSTRAMATLQVIAEAILENPIMSAGTLLNLIKDTCPEIYEKAIK